MKQERITNPRSILGLNLHLKQDGGTNVVTNYVRSRLAQVVCPLEAWVYPTTKTHRVHSRIEFSGAALWYRKQHTLHNPNDATRMFCLIAQRPLFRSLYIFYLFDWWKSDRNFHKLNNIFLNNNFERFLSKRRCSRFKRKRKRSNVVHNINWHRFRENLWWNFRKFKHHWLKKHSI